MGCGVWGVLGLTLPQNLPTGVWLAAARGSQSHCCPTLLPCCCPTSSLLPPPPTPTHTPTPPPPHHPHHHRFEKESETAEFVIDETFGVPGVGTVVAGTVKAGSIAPNATLLIGPDIADGSFKAVSVKSVHYKRLPVGRVSE